MEHSANTNSFICVVMFEFLQSIVYFQEVLSLEVSGCGQ